MADMSHCYRYTQHLAKKEMKRVQSQAVALAKSPLEERPAPIQGKTLPSACLTTIASGERLAAWLQSVKLEEEAPTAEQLAILDRVAQQVLQEFR